MEKIRIGILGYGNLARGILDNLQNFPDMEAVAVFSRRPNAVSGAPCAVFSADELLAHRGTLDVLMLCGGSATDLPVQTPMAASAFCVVDSFDTHAKIPQHISAVDAAAKEAGTLALISGGWDPGLFSLARVLFGSFLPNGTDYTFWGKGVSQGHSDALRRIDGVKKAVQYTVPKPEALQKVRDGSRPTLSVRDKHLRECYIVAADGADLQKIEREVVSMPNYFADYDTVVHFVDDDVFERDHKAMPHGGTVLRSGQSTPQAQQLLELKITLDSNPHFTSGILLSYARAVFRLKKAGKVGCITPLDIAPSDLFLGSREELLKLL